MQLRIVGLCFTDATGAPFTHEPWLVALSFAIAAVASYAALDMAERLRLADATRAPFWHLGSAGALGGGIWAMHFLGMLAFDVGVPVGYDPFLTIFSLVLAIAVVALGLQMVRGALAWQRLIGAGVVVGSGIAGMHYTGMSAISLPGRIAFTPGLWLASVLIAAAAATAALWLALTPHARWQRMGAALVMAAAICGMHYTGMAATVIELDPTRTAQATLPNAPLAAAVAGTTVALLLLALMSVAADRRLSAAAQREEERLRWATAELEAAHREMVRRLCSASEFRDQTTGQHIARMAQLSRRLALAAGCDAAFADRLLEAAPLHDVGKIAIPDAVLLKRGKLDPAEWEIMRGHAEIGARLLAGSGMPLLDLAAEVALTHHEKWDGSGYPRGLAGEAIPLAGRVVAIADVVDALLSRRPYKEPWPLEQVVAYLNEQSGRHFDPSLVRVFLSDLDGMVSLRAAFADA
jgi:NO-binding membrane sensor protein with MHYT domain